jgi:hypothetical protein
VKEKSHRKLSLATTIPTSARFGFKLLASTSVRETAAFRALDTTCSDYISEVQLQLKGYIVQVADLQLVAITTEKLNLLISSITDFAKGYCRVYHGMQPTNAILFSYVYHTIQQLSKNTDVLCGMLLPATDYNPLIIRCTGYNPSTPTSFDAPLASDVVFPKFIVDCTAILLGPCVQYDASEARQRLTLVIKSLEVLRVKEKVTAATFDLLESEPSTTPALLANLVDDSVGRSLNRRNNLSEKNSSGGANASDPLNTKKLQPPKKSTSSKPAVAPAKPPVQPMDPVRTVPSKLN